MNLGYSAANFQIMECLVMTLVISGGSLTKAKLALSDSHFISSSFPGWSKAIDAVTKLVILPQLIKTYWPPVGYLLIQHTKCTSLLALLIYETAISHPFQNIKHSQYLNSQRVLNSKFTLKMSYMIICRRTNLLAGLKENGIMQLR